MKRRRLASVGFLPQIPVGSLIARQQEIDRLRSAQPLGNDGNFGVNRAEARHPSDSHEESTCLDVVKKKRSDMPVVRKVDKGDLEKAVALCNSSQGKQQALDGLLSDMYAATSKKPRDALLKTWMRLHRSWFGDTGVEPFPLDEMKLVRVSALFKVGGYKSFKNYLSRAKDQHLQLGHSWTEALNRTSQKCVRSVTRGLAGATRSEAFDIVSVVGALQSNDHSLADGGPKHPKAMVVCSTYFMLRELEASAVDRNDIVFGDAEVTLSLPVSKTDWEAKGCRRTWACICDRQLICPFHVLKEHCLRLEKENFKLDGPLFPDELGEYCTKAGVVETIRQAAQLAGMQTLDSDGQHRLSGHTFRITGARYLSSVGLDPITIQLLGRWGSNAVLSYLAESPLLNMSQRLRSLDTKRLEVAGISEPLAFGEMDQRVRAMETLLADQEWKQQLRQTQDQVESILSSIKLQSEQILQITDKMERPQVTDLRKVINTRSGVEHLAQISNHSSPHSWRTKCGWSFSGKGHAETFAHDAKLIHTYPLCPKCHLNPDRNDSSSSSSDTED